MKKCLLFFLYSLITEGVFGESVSVKEGGSVTLHTGLTEIQKNDEIEWWFGANLDRIARMKKDPRIYEDALNGTFRGRLKLDGQTGDLTITNIKTTDTGVYEVSNSIKTLEKFSVTVVPADVSAAAVKSVSVMVGDSVTLQTGLTDIQRDDVIRWFDHQKSLVAEINRKAGIFNTYDVPDGRFRDRLQLDHQTGSLNIKNIGTTDSGLCEVDIIRTSSKHTIHKTFNVTVSDEVKLLSDKERESVTLQANVTEIQKDDLILWMFGDIVIAEIHKADQRFFTYGGPDGRFRDRLKLDHQTGSLNITDTRTTDSGLYELKISSSRHTIFRRFIVTVIDAVKTVSVMEGNSATLPITEIQKDDLKLWMFGDIKLAEIHKADQRFFTYDGPDGRFRDRLKLDHQTGSLIITDTRTTDSGLYELKISSSRHTIFRRFVVTVIGADLSPTTKACIGGGVLLVVAVAVVYVIYCCNKISKPKWSWKTLSVIEGETVPLYPSDTEIIKNNIRWLFNKSHLAEIKRKSPEPFNVLHENFKGRLDWPGNLGPLIIKNIQIQDSGLYELQIRSGNNDQTLDIFRVTVYAKTEIKIKYVNKGGSVTLESGVTGIHKDDEIIWMFGPENTPIAAIQGGRKKTPPFAAGWRSIFRLKLDENGSLTIKNIRCLDAGFYALHITKSGNTSLHLFRVKIYTAEYVTMEELRKNESQQCKSAGSDTENSPFLKKEGNEEHGYEIL